MTKPALDLKASNGVNIGLYAGVNGVGLVATLRTAAGVEEKVTLAGGDGWEVLTLGLRALTGVGQQIIIYTNHAEIADALQHPRRPPAPDRTMNVKGWGKVGYGGNQAHWACLIALTQYGSRFHAKLVPGEYLQRAKAIYEQSNVGNGSTGTASTGTASAVVGGTTEVAAAGSGGIQPSLFTAAAAPEGRDDTAPVLDAADRASIRHVGHDDGHKQADADSAGHFPSGGSSRGSLSDRRDGTKRVHEVLSGIWD